MKNLPEYYKYEPTTDVKPAPYDHMLMATVWGLREMLKEWENEKSNV